MDDRTYKELVMEYLRYVDGATCQQITSYISIYKVTTRYTSGGVNTLLANMVKKGEVEIVNGKTGPRGGRVYKLK